MTTAYLDSTARASADFYRNAPRNARPETNSQPEDNSPDSEKLMDRFAAKMRALHYSLSTEKVYRHWIVQFLRFHRRGRQWRHPTEMGKTEIEAFLEHLAVARNVAAKTQNQAFSAILFLYRKVLAVDLPLIDALRARESPRLPVVLSRDEVARLIVCVEGGGGVYRLMVELAYGSGLRLMECCRLRVKDVDFERRQLRAYPKADRGGDSGDFEFGPGAGDDGGSKDRSAEESRRRPNSKSPCPAGFRQEHAVCGVKNDVTYFASIRPVILSLHPACSWRNAARERFWDRLLSSVRAKATRTAPCR